MPNWERELEVALSAANEAGVEIMRQYASFEAIANAPADISTAADRASQEIIFHRLREAFPDDGLFGEERTSLRGTNHEADRRWIVDPIDGTRGFAMKNGEFSVMIALVVGGWPMVGVVAEPAADRVTFATRGGGCFLQQPIGGTARLCETTQTAALRHATLSISRSQKDAGEKKLLEAFGASAVVRTYSAGVKLAQVARGDTDMYLGDYLTLRDWDVCAGHLLVTEAGGDITSVKGTAIAYDGSGDSLHGDGILATNGPLHRDALAVLASGRYTF